MHTNERIGRGLLLTLAGVLCLRASNACAVQPGTTTAAGVAPYAHGICVQLDPTHQKVRFGQTFNIQVRIPVASQSNPVVTAKVALAFDSKRLEVVKITGGGPLGAQVVSTFSNALGRIDYLRTSSGGERAQSPFTLATITLKARQGLAGAPGTLQRNWPTMITYRPDTYVHINKPSGLFPVSNCNGHKRPATVNVSW
ncbi:MAG: hypothetical protein HY554_17785 [Elusimicrobia bacterium]|nr:hypothetical protein [Elusimicrobiota bacterium]